MRDHRRSHAPLPVAATILYASGLLALVAVSLSLGGGETEPGRWALTALPVTLFAAASLVVRLASIRSGDDT